MSYFKKISLSLVVLCLLGTTAFMGTSTLSAQDNSGITIDKRSYQLGGVGAFSEMVGVGLKKLALGSPISSEEMDIMFPEIEKVAKRFDVIAYRETDFLVTDLFDEALTKGFELSIIYKGDTLREYKTLKFAKKNMVRAGTYTGRNREFIARGMGRLLSYSDARITEMLKK